MLADAGHELRPGRRLQARFEIAQSRALGLGRPVQLLIEPIAVPRRTVLEIELPEAVAAGLECAQARLCGAPLLGLRSVHPESIGRGAGVLIHRTGLMRESPMNWSTV